MTYQSDNLNASHSSDVGHLFTSQVNVPDDVTYRCNIIVIVNALRLICLYRAYRGWSLVIKAGKVEA